MKPDIDVVGAVDELNEVIVERPGYVVVAFLLVTAVFAAGIPLIEVNGGLDLFVEDLDAYHTYQDVDAEFGPVGESEPYTQLIQRNENVLTKDSVLRMLKAQHRVDRREGLRVTSTRSYANAIATQLDPSARTLERQIAAVERARPSEIQGAVRTLRDDRQFRKFVSDDFNPESTTATAGLAVVEHSLPEQAPLIIAATTPETPIQQRTQRVVDSVGGDISVFGNGIISAELGNAIFDSLFVVVPFATIVIVFFLFLSYRDIFDMLLGGVALFMVVIWTMGLVGYLNIPFTLMLIAVPPLLLGVGVDFGIHVVNMYREQDVEDVGISTAMRETTEHLQVAFFIVTGTTVIGFLANVTSPIRPIRDFGVVAAAGITFALLAFAVFLPAAKILTDRWRERHGLTGFTASPLGEEESLLGSILPVGVRLSRPSPAVFLAVVLVVSGSLGVYATGVDTTFKREDFLPSREKANALEDLPDPFTPSDYTAKEDLEFVEDNFESTGYDTVTIYTETPIERTSSLETIHRAGRDPPDTFESDDRMAVSRSVVSTMEREAQSSPEYATLFAESDTDGNGVPDTNTKQMFDRLFASSSADVARQYVDEQRGKARVVYSVDSDASMERITEDARDVAANYPGDATVTGETVVYQATSRAVYVSAARGLAVSLGLSLVFLVVIYGILEGRPSLGVVNLIPILSTVAALVATMRYFGIPLNTMTATILAITLGVGVDYTVHATHRAVEEHKTADTVFTALVRTLRGTGGALTGSMVTDVLGIGTLVVATSPILSQFGILMSLSILYSYLAAVLVLPATFAVWDTLTNPTLEPDGPA